MNVAMTLETLWSLRLCVSTSQGRQGSSYVGCDGQGMETQRHGEHRGVGGDQREVSVFESLLVDRKQVLHHCEARRLPSDKNQREWSLFDTKCFEEIIGEKEYEPTKLRG